MVLAVLVTPMAVAEVLAEIQEMLAVLIAPMESPAEHMAAAVVVREHQQM
jgi:hypothetical protein